MRYADVLDAVARRAEDGDREDYAVAFRQCLKIETGERYRRPIESATPTSGWPED